MWPEILFAAAGAASVWGPALGLGWAKRRRARAASAATVAGAAAVLGPQYRGYDS